MKVGDSVLLLVVNVLLGTSGAHATNRCTSLDGKVTYQDAPCPSAAKSAQRLELKENTLDFVVPRLRPSVGGATAEDTIALKCAQDWPNDFRMRAFCQRKQAEGLRGLDRALDASSSDAAVIRIKCAKDWPDDYRMRAFCERKQVEGLRELGR